MVDEVSSDGADSDDNLDKGKKFRELLKVNTNYALVQKIVKINEDLVKSTNVDRLKVGADDLIPMMIDTIKKILKIIEKMT